MSVVLPIVATSVAAIRVSDSVFLVRTPVVGGGQQDYTEYEMVNAGSSIGISQAWCLRSIRACVGGVLHQLMDQSGFKSGDVGTVEFAIRVGHLSDPLGAYSFYGFGHGHLSYGGLGIFLDGGAANYREPMPEQAVIRGASLVFDCTYTALLGDGLPVGTVNLAHIFDASGLRISHTHKVIAAGVGMQNSYSTMLPATNCDRVQAGTTAPVVIGTGSALQVGNWGAQSHFALWNSARPSVRLEMELPYGAPSDSAAGWGECTTSRTFLNDNPLNQKLYVNCRSGELGQPFTGQHNYLTAYRVRKT
jgi:hypothetical protein